MPAATIRDSRSNDVAIIGLSGRFPGARNVGQLWQNLKAGVDSISFFSEEELAESGVNIAEVRHDPNFVRAGGVLEDAELFDASFFRVYPHEASLMDPQARLMLECSWEALEDAGYDPDRFPGLIGVYAGMSNNAYFWANLLPNLGTVPGVSSFQTQVNNEADGLATRVSYKLNLKGPSVTLLTACSTSLVAVAEACQSLLAHQCDMALAGGVSVVVPQRRGYWYEQGGMLSPDGHCRPFDERANGTVFTNGVGLVVLKRLGDALDDGDHIYAIIKAVAVNNDGGSKLSFAAPSVEGQTAVITSALHTADVGPDSISYVECHGTATPLGDPIELAGLARALRAQGDTAGHCAIGSLKSNIGHLDAAAGVASLIKTALALHHGLIPPTIRFKMPNPRLNLEKTPFYVNTKLMEWPAQKAPRRAGVNSFGVGGTNAHAILEEPPPVPSAGDARPWQLLPMSAPTPSALEPLANNLARHLKENPGVSTADVAYTLQLGRHQFDHRRFVVCRDGADAARVLESLHWENVASIQRSPKNASVVFMFPGQGSQYPDMGRQLYETEPTFRNQVDRCAEFLKPSLGVDLRQIIYGGLDQEECARRLSQTSLAQPAIFVIEYALAGLWAEWGVRPAKMIGHSIGEFVAACLAGVFSLEDALTLIAARGRLMQGLPGGAMMAVPLPEPEVTPLLDGQLSLAAVNGPANCVVSGPAKDVDRLEQHLSGLGVAGRRLHTSHAFHSPMMDPILDTFTQEVQNIRLCPPQLPFISSPTGTWITAEQATDLLYWARHMREPVRFADGRRELASNGEDVLLEVGPGNTLSTLANHPGYGATGQKTASSLGHVLDEHHDLARMLEALGVLWVAGVAIDWQGVHVHHRRFRVPLPTYPFERKRYWIDPPTSGDALIFSPSGPRVFTFGSGAPGVQLQQNGGQEPGFKTASQAAPAGMLHAAPERVNEEEIPMSQANPSHETSRRERVLVELKSIVQDLSGLSPEEMDTQITFLEMGFDSLFLTQASLSLKKKFGLDIGFRQLMEETPTLDALGDLIDRQLPPDAPLPASAPAAAAPETQWPVEPPALETEKSRAAPVTVPLKSSSATAASASTLERIMEQQLQVMARQLELLGQGVGGGDGPSASKITGLDAGPAEPLLREPGGGPPPAPRGSDAAAPQRFGPWKPVDRSEVPGLEAWQRTHLDSLVVRYVARTRKSRELAEEHRRYLADPRVVSGFRAAWKEMVYPIVVNRSSGSRLWDVDGNEYVDLIMGFGSVLFGHSPDFVTHALEEQLKMGIEIGPQSPLAGEVARAVCEMTGMERAAFCNTGSEAVLAAMRVARTVTGRDKVAVFAQDYHGIFDEVLVRGGLGQGGAPGALPIAPGIPRRAVQNILVLERRDSDALRLLDQHADELAAVLVEPVPSRHPDVQEGDFLRELREWTARKGVALVFDEIITGFRLHPRGAQGWFGVEADLATYGKVLGGGMPIGMLAGKDHFMDALDGGTWRYGDASVPESPMTYFAGTFVRHPLTLAATAATLEQLRKGGPELQQGLNERSSCFIHHLNAHFHTVGAPLHLEHCGSLFYLGFLEESPFSSLLFFHLREKGVHIWENRPTFISLAHTDADLDLVARAFEESVAQMQEAGFLSGGPGRPPVSSGASVKMALAAGPAPVADRGLVATAVPGDLPAESRFPLTESQMEIWLTAQIGDDASRSFNENIVLRLEGALDLEAMRSAVQQLVDRHEALRTTFSPDGEYQQVGLHLAVELLLVDLSSEDAGARDRELDEFFQANVHKAFDLVNGPLVRGWVLKLQEDEHLLVLSAHHIVCDGWSIHVLVLELGELYSALCRGEVATLTPPVQFSEYAHQERQRQSSPEALAAEKFWLEQFTGNVPPLELPTDHPRPRFQTFNGARERARIEKPLYDAMKRVGAQRGCTAFATFLAAYCALLNRLAGQEELVTAIWMAGQATADASNLVGDCVNTFPLRCRVDPNEPFSSLLKSVNHLLLEAREHRHYTLGTLVRNLNLSRDPSRAPLVSAVFNLDPELRGVSFSGLEVELCPDPNPYYNFELFFELMESQGGLVLECEYNADLFDASTIRRWLGHFQTLLEGVISEPDRPVSRLPMLNEAERQQMLEEWNATDFELPETETVHELVRTQVERCPDSPAVVFEGQQMSYRQLDQRSNQLARYLQKVGVGPQELVGVSVERSTDMLVSLLAVLKAGGAYVPLDPTYPRERLAFMMSDAGLHVLLTEERLAPALLPLGGLGNGSRSSETVYLDAHWPVISQESAETLPTTASPDDLAYVIYTSGSTGKPKGVPVTHRSFVNLLAAMARRPGMTEIDRLLAVTTLSFDISGLELFLPLSVGGCVVIASREASSDGQQLAKLLDTAGVTIIQATPATWQLLLEAGWPENRGLKALCGGEALPADLAGRLLERAGSLWNLYGPTETTIWSAVHEVREGDDPVPLGRPIDNTKMYVLNEALELVPIGVAGELYIGGAGVAQGYLNRPQLTAERFVQDPFGDSSSRLYKTGDIVRYLPDGALQFLGRGDHQVKVRGFRIELSDVEANLRDHPAVQDAVAVVREVEPGDRRIAAYVVPAGKEGLSAQELRSFLREKLPEYMVPATIVSLETLPRTANGKLDRTALPVPQPSPPEVGDTDGQPGTEMEMLVAQVWRDALDLEMVGANDNFFDLGGHSLLAIKVIRALEKGCGVRINPRELMYQSLRQLAATCEDRARDSQRAEPVSAVGRMLRAVGRTVTSRSVESH